MDKAIQLYYDIRLLGKPFTELDPRREGNSVKLLRGYEFEGVKYYEIGDKLMPIDEAMTSKITDLKPAIFTAGLFVKLTGVHDKDTLKWILVKFLKETLDYLGDPENRARIKSINRGKLIEEWIDVNMPSLEGSYDRN